MERRLMALTRLTPPRATRWPRFAYALLSMILIGFTAPALAQSVGFAPAITVNSRVISEFELRQRVLFMTLLRQPGDIPALAKSSLIDDAIRRDAAKKLDVSVTPEEVKAGMAEFAARTKLPMDTFLKALAQGGVQPETLRDFIEAGLVWRAVIRAKFAPKTEISDAEVDRAIGAGAASGGELRVLLSEIILPTTQVPEALALAQRIKLTVTNEKTFAIAAKNFSKAPTANGGGALGWIPTSALPPSVASQVLGLKVGEMTDPIVIPGAVELFYLRDLSLSEGDAKGPVEVDYAQYFFPAGSNTALIRAQLDTCDDLYDAAKGLPAQALQRQTAIEDTLTLNLRAALATMDEGESVVLNADSATPFLLMLCKRQPQSQVAPSRDDVRSTLLNTKLGLLANAYMEELRSNAIIVVK